MVPAQVGPQITSRPVTIWLALLRVLQNSCRLCGCLPPGAPQLDLSRTGERSIEVLWLTFVPLDRTHITVRTLKRLLPEATIAGGSFGSDLPHPNEIPRDERRIVFETAQIQAINDCTRELLHHAGLPESTQVRRGLGGEPLWPSEFVGSLTHKGTVVLAALGTKSVFRALGIDVEYMDSTELGPIEHNVAWEGLPPGVEQSLGILLSLSAKEAVFKAQYPLTKQLLDFSDIALKWVSNPDDTFVANVDCGGTMVFRVRCTAANLWIVSTAFLSAKA